MCECARCHSLLFSRYLLACSSRLPLGIACASLPDHTAIATYGIHSSSCSSSNKTAWKFHFQCSARVHRKFKEIKKRIIIREASGASSESEETPRVVVYALTIYSSCHKHYSAQTNATYSVQFYAFQFKTSKINYIKFLHFVVVALVLFVCLLVCLFTPEMVHYILSPLFISIVWVWWRLFSARMWMHSQSHPNSKSFVVGWDIFSLFPPRCVRVPWKLWTCANAFRSPFTSAHAHCTV